MKKKLSALFIIFITIILSSILFQPKLYTEVIVSAQEDVDLESVNLFYSDLISRSISAYHTTPTGVVASKYHYKPYSQGFMRFEDFKYYMNIMFLNKGYPTTTFQTYYEDDQLAAFAFPGDLSNFTLIDKVNHKVYPLQLKNTDLLSPMYVSDIRRINDQLIVLAGEANSYTALIYVINLPTLTVSSQKRLATHPSAINPMHYDLDDEGNAYFINGSQVLIYNPFEDKVTYIPLTFKATGLVASPTPVVYEDSEQTIKYALLDKSNESSKVRLITPPSPSSYILDLEVQGHYIYLCFVDPSGIRFKNYVCVYNLQTTNLVYCLGLEDSINASLMSMSLTHSK